MLWKQTESTELNQECWGGRRGCNLGSDMHRRTHGKGDIEGETWRCLRRNTSSLKKANAQGRTEHAVAQGPATESRRRSSRESSLEGLILWAKGSLAARSVALIPWTGLLHWGFYPSFLTRLRGFGANAGLNIQGPFSQDKGKGRHH